MKTIAKEIVKYKEKYENMPVNIEAKPVSRKEFTLLLSGMSTCRKLPGVPVHMGYEELYHCQDEEGIAQTKEHLAKLFGVKDKDTLMKACYQIYSGSDQYEQFMTFWSNAPLFDVKKLHPDAAKGFNRCREIAEHFYPIVKEKGFYAWDIDQRIGLCRGAVACGILTEEEFWQITDAWVCQAQVFYHSYAEYAISCLCGAVYDMGRYEDASGFFDIQKNIAESLLAEGGAWQRNQWYVPAEREWAELLRQNPGCFVTKRALDEGCGYMYREEPSPEYPDSGWRFFVGDEPDDYVNNPDNISVCGLNTICNLWPDVMAFLNAEVGRSFGRQKSGWVEE